MNHHYGFLLLMLMRADLEISGLKARVKSFEDKVRRRSEPTQEDAPITRGIIDIGEELEADKSTELGSNDTKEMVNMLSSMEAVNILSSGGAAASVSPVDVLPTAGVPTVSGSFPNEQIDAQVAREIEEEFARENQRLSEQVARDFEIARIHVEEEVKLMIEGLDRSNELVPLEEVHIEALQVKHPIIDLEIHSKGKREYWKIIRLGGHTEAYQIFIDMLKQFDREDLHQLWILVKETFSIKQPIKDKEKEL
nr:hypothetical protein [Tanacetum cinerariifolium]